MDTQSSWHSSTGGLTLYLSLLPLSPQQDCMPLCELWQMECGQKRYAALPGLNHKAFPQKSLTVSLFSFPSRAARERQTQSEPREHLDFKTTRNKSLVVGQLAWELTWMLIMVAYPKVCWRGRSRKSQDQGHFGLLMPLSQQAVDSIRSNYQ